jgi:hypothetical protein
MKDLRRVRLAEEGQDPRQTLIEGEPPYEVEAEYMHTEPWLSRGHWMASANFAGVLSCRDDDIETQLNGLSRLGEPIWIAPLLPEEISPGSWCSLQLEATGEPTWTGTIDRAAIRRYRAEFARLEQQLRRWLQKRGGYHVRIDALAPQELFFRPLLQRGGPLGVPSG